MFILVLSQKKTTSLDFECFLFHLHNLNIPPSKIEIRKGINDKYFKIWIKKSKSIFTKYRISKIIKKHNSDVEKFDYSLIKL